jgi:endonuclease/exonuclease/phosphatase family metal-dependent hydrolase
VHELREIFISVGGYTWFNNQEFPTLEKLDIILVNREFEALLPTTHEYKIPRLMSDHNPLILSSQQPQVYDERV